LRVEQLGRGSAWLDTGTPESLLDASNLIHTLSKRQGLQVACLEEVAFREGFINKEQLLARAEPLKKTDYGAYLIGVANGR
jgi:glucose-1-phosphate thymidylyltransferase